MTPGREAEEPHTHPLRGWRRTPPPPTPYKWTHEHGVPVCAKSPRVGRLGGTHQALGGRTAPNLHCPLSRGDRAEGGGALVCFLAIHQVPGVLAPAPRPWEACRNPPPSLSLGSALSATSHQPPASAPPSDLLPQPPYPPPPPLPGSSLLLCFLGFLSGAGEGSWAQVWKPLCPPRLP